MKKYKLRKDLEHPTYKNLYRIEALRDFGNVKKGDIGGYIEHEDNLSHEGDCWVYEDALVFEKAHVSGNAHVFGKAHVSGKARVSGDAYVSGDAWVYGHARVYGKAKVHGHAWVGGQSDISDDIKLYEDEVYKNITLPEIPRIIRESELYKVLENNG